MLKVLSIDASTANIGYALRKGKDVVMFGTLVHGLKPIVPMFFRLNKLANLFQHLCVHKLPIILDYIIIERSFVQGSGDVTRALCEIQGMIKLILFRQYEDNFTLVEPSPSTWRYYFIGTGKVDKKKTEVIQRCKQLGYNPKTEHEAESIAMALCFGDDLLKVLGIPKRDNFFDEE